MPKLPINASSIPSLLKSSTTTLNGAGALGGSPPSYLDKSSVNLPVPSLNKI